MSNETDLLHSTLALSQNEVMNLREGYGIVNSRYSAALASLKKLTDNTTEAIKRAAAAAENAAIVSSDAAATAKKEVAKAVTTTAQYCAAATSG